MAKLLVIRDYTVHMAGGARGFNEWRQSIFVRTSETGINCDIRFVDEPENFRNLEKVREDGNSLVFQDADAFDRTLHLLQSEKPLFIVLYGSPSDRVVIQTGPEPVGDDE